MHAAQNKHSNGWKTPRSFLPMIGKLRIGFVSSLAATVLLSGCYSMKSLDRKTSLEVEETAASQSGISGETAADAAQSASVSDFPPGASISLNSKSVLEIATEYSRELQDRRDDLYRSALSLFGTRRDFSIELTGTAEYIFNGGDEVVDGDQGAFKIAANRILPTGGNLEATASQDYRTELIEEINDRRYSSIAAVRIDQPLLAGAGYEASHESLIQSERDFIYSLRDFTLERQDFAIETLRQYYSLLGQRKVVENTETNYQQFVYLRQRSEALFKVNRAPSIDVMRSQQEELTALNRLTSTRESYSIQFDRFLVQLGLPSAMDGELADDIPEMLDIKISETNALAMSLKKRIDLQTVRDQLEDARRRLRSARNNMLPDVSLIGAATWTSSDAESISDQEHRQNWQAGVQAEIPFDKRDDRDALKNTMIEVKAAERELALREETVVLEVREGFSRLRSLTVSVEIQLKNIEIAKRRAENALLQFRNGTLSNRDVVEAANDLLDARNSYITALTDYAIQRLVLLRQIGLLDVSREGAIIELNPDV